MELWIVGEWKDDGPWEIAGVFDSKEKAVAACLNDCYFIGPVILNEALTAETVIWPGAYYPLCAK